MPFTGPVSVLDATDTYEGSWSRAYAIANPLTAPTEIYLGVVKEGVLRVTRETAQFFGTTFPAKLEIEAPINVGMQFSGTAYELTHGLIHFLVGDDSINSASQYIYPGAGCAFGDIDVVLRIERMNCNGKMIVAQIHRARASGVFELGSSENDWVGTPIEINALNDENNTFSGMASATSPLGYIWVSSAT